MATERATGSHDETNPGNEKAAALGRALDLYREELHEVGILSTLELAKQEFGRTVSGTTPRGDRYGFGGLRPDMTVMLYGLVRELRPGVCVETGVCNGESTAVILAALARNDTGVLHSIDLPEVANSPAAPGTFWEGKKGAAIPAGKQPGWLIPDHLRVRWALTLGRSQDTLHAVLQHLQAIDFFLHDSEHSAECMRFEYEAAWEHLRPGGVLASDDIAWNDEFEAFCRRVSRRAVSLGPNAAFLVK